MGDFVKCTLKPGALVIVGSGGWRNTATSGYAGEDSIIPAGTHIDEKQEPDAKWLQYIVHPKTQAADCYRYKLDADDMWNSMNGTEIHTVQDGEYIDKSFDKQ